MRPEIEEIEDAILAAATEATKAYMPKSQVHTLSGRNLDFAEQQIIAVAPAVIAIYLGGPLSPETADLKTYSLGESFLLLVVVSSLRGAEAARRGGAPKEQGAYKILADLKYRFAGAQLDLPNDAHVHTQLVGASYEGMTKDGDFVYGLELVARGHWQAVG